MIRAIDTQVIYSQTPTQSSQQHIKNQQPVLQQDQFAHIAQKEVQNKKETVYDLEKQDKLDNDLEKRHFKKKGQQKDSEKEENDKEKKTDKNKEKVEKLTSIDIRL
jgi:hypothetical protein